MRPATSRGRRLAALALLSTIPLAGTPVAARSRGTSCTPDQVRVWRITRNGGAPRDLDATVEYTGRGTRSALMVVAAERVGDGWRPTQSVMRIEIGANDAYPYVDGGDAVPVTTPQRPDAVKSACDGASSTFTLPLKRNRSAHDWFVATLTTDVRITVKSPGWTVTGLPADSGANLRIYRTADGKGLSSEVRHQGFEHFTGVAADGGRYGSVAWARLPCEDVRSWALTAPPGYMTGWGAAVLYGGDSTPFSRSDRSLKCDGYDQSGVGQASGPTRWVVDGEAIGLTVGLDRLTVFDFPKPDARGGKYVRVVQPKKTEKT